MKNSFKYILLISLLIFTVSCSDDDDNKKSTSTTNYYPLTSGSYWVYLKAEVKADGSLGSTIYERNEVSETEVISGKNTTKINTYEGDAPNNIGIEVIESNNYYSENGKTYASISYIDRLLSVEALGVNIPKPTNVDFIKLIDENASSWNVIEIPLNELPLQYQGQEIRLTGKATLKAKSLGEKLYTNLALSLNGNSAAYEYEFEISGNVSFIIVGQNVPAGTISIKSTIERWFMKDVGQVKRVDSAIEISSTGTISTILNTLDKFSSSVYELNSYSVIKLEN